MAIISLWNVALFGVVGFFFCLFFNLLWECSGLSRDIIGMLFYC